MRTLKTIETIPGTRVPDAQEWVDKETYDEACRINQELVQGKAFGIPFLVGGLVASLIWMFVTLIC